MRAPVVEVVVGTRRGVRVALAKEPIRVGRIFTLESCPFPGRSVNVAEKSLGGGANTAWSLQRPTEQKEPSSQPVP